MNEQQYYKQIKELIETYEINNKVRYMQDNHEKLLTNWKIGKILVEAQGGLNRAKYGDGLIKKWAIELEKIFGNNYSKRNLMLYRKFYLLYPKVNALRTQLNWTHYRMLLSIKNESERNYYINYTILNNLSTRELEKIIKSRAYERLVYIDKENITLIENNNKNNLTIEDMIKDPILIKVDSNVNKLDEKALHKYIISMLENRFLELGTGFALIGHEYKIMINNHTYKIDLLFFNYLLNAFIVVELKTKEYHPKDKGQLEFYVNYVDKNIRLDKHNSTIGLLIVKKKDKYVIEYVTNEDIYVTTYKLVV